MSVTTTTTDLWRMSATDLAEAIRSKQVSSQEVIEAHLRRIEALNPAINAVTVVLGERALETAKGSRPRGRRRRRSTAVARRPLHPKENIDLAGTPTIHGLKALAGAYPGLDAPVVERMRAAARSRSAAPTYPTSRFDGTPTANSGAASRASRESVAERAVASIGRGSRP